MTGSDGARVDLSGVRIVDQHAHNVLSRHPLDAPDYLAAFSEGRPNSALIEQVPETLFFKRSVRELATLLDCEPVLAEVLAARNGLTAEALTRRCIAAAGIDVLLLDDGWLSDESQPTKWHAAFARVRRVERVERLAERLIPDCASFDELAARLQSALADAASSSVAFKTIVAYRTGLRIDRHEKRAVAAAFDRCRLASRRASRVRLADKPLNDWLVRETLKIAAVSGRPVQFHTGFGDPDLRLREADPLHLQALLEQPAFAAVPFVLLHAGYPFTRHGGWLASVYSNVHLDLGLAIPLLSRRGMQRAIEEALELAPLPKLLFSTDAHAIPELFYLGAREGRAALEAVLGRAVHDGDLAIDEAVAAGHAILHANAERLYRLR